MSAASNNHSRDVLSILESYAAMNNGETGINSGVQEQEDMEPLAAVPPSQLLEHQQPSSSTTPNHAVAATAVTMSYTNLLDKPKRPLSAYNIFFQHEREKIISNAPDKPVTVESLKINSKRKVKKRRHRKSHGKIGFADLARTIAEKWKTLDPESRAVFDSCAAKEKERYRRELKEWKALKKTQVAAEQEAAKKKALVDRVEGKMYESSSSNNRMNHGIANTDLQDDIRTAAGTSDWSSRTMAAAAGMNSERNLQGRTSSSMDGVQDPREYLKITQQVIDMARASLSLPLFANLGRTSMLEDTLNARTFLREQPPLRMNRNPTSSLLYSSNDMESSQFANSALLNVPLRTNMASLGNDSRLYQSQLMRGRDSSLTATRAAQLREELEARALLNRPMHYRQAELDPAANRQDVYSRLGRATQRHGYNGLTSAQSRQGDGDDLVNLINASRLRDPY